jgi:hypothetical protein
VAWRRAGDVQDETLVMYEERVWMKSSGRYGPVLTRRGRKRSKMSRILSPDTLVTPLSV